MALQPFLRSSDGALDDFLRHPARSRGKNSCVCQYLPALLSTLLCNEGLAVFGDTAAKYSLTALGTPDQVVDDMVDAVFISLIIHVGIVVYNNTLINKSRAVEVRLKPEKVPHCASARVAPRSPDGSVAQPGGSPSRLCGRGVRAFGVEVITPSGRIDLLIHHAGVSYIGLHAELTTPNQRCV